ncbi:MAG: hypothetical protein H7245_08310 [Candidatus Saccharibacteria bacterium]|nr:hypothetical protein [Pseudorhodobacter sp.]
MSRSRRMTLVEAVSNVVAGFGLAVGLQLLLFPAFGLHPTIVRSLVIGARFTLLACLGSDILRRFFERSGSGPYG